MEKDNKMKKEEIRERGKYYGCMIALSGTLLCLILLMCTGCTTTRYVPVVEHRTDTVQITRQQRDSIWLHDSIYTHEYIQGDTTFIMRDRWKLLLKCRSDPRTRELLSGLLADFGRDKENKGVSMFIDPGYDSGF